MTALVSMATTATAGPVPGIGGLPLAGLIGGGETADPTGGLALPGLGGGSAAPGGLGVLPGLTGKVSQPTAPGDSDLLPGLPLLDGRSPAPSSTGPTVNLTTPGATANPPDGPTYFGAPTSEATPGVNLPSGETVYSADPAAQSFDGPTTGGWYGYQEYSLLCDVRGVGCVNWNFHHEPTGGPNGDGDGFLRINGTSLGVAPCTPQNGVARWNSPLFTYSTANAKSWKMSFDERQTELLVGEGHSSYAIQILDEDGRILSTATGPQMTFPMNEWTHHDIPFDGSKMVFGKNYRMSIMVDVVHAETALNWGNMDFDNVVMSVTPAAGEQPFFNCTISGSSFDGLDGLLSGRPADLCPTTNQVGQSVAPLTDALYDVLSSQPLDGLLNRLSGVVAIADLETGQFFGYLFGKESIPSLDARDVMVYVKDGTAGEAVNYVIMFALSPIGLVEDVLSEPVPKVSHVVDGQVGNLEDLLADPGRLLRIPLDWSGKDLNFALSTMVDQLKSESAPPTQLGGRVWLDTNQNGIEDDDEPCVPGVRVTLTDANGTSYGTQVTDSDGRYLFDHLQPRSDPSNYFLTFDKDSLPAGASFTTKHVPGSVHANTSNPDQTTGRTDRIAIVRGQSDLDWNAGVIGGTPPGPPAPPAPPAPPSGTVSINIGPSTVNGEPAASAPGPQVNSDDQVTITVPVTNTGTVPVTLTGTSSAGPVSCPEGAVQPGATVNCTVTTTADRGPNTVTVNITGTGPDGQQQSAGCEVFFVGRCPVEPNDP